MALSWLIARPVAHRGFHDAAAGRIENSRSAVAAAAERGFAIEVDLRITGDGGVVVFHDPTLTRLSGSDRRVDEAPLSWLLTQRLAGSSDTIWSFDDLLDLVAGQVPLVLELKTDAKGDGRLEAGTAKSLAGYNGLAAVMSFDPACVARMRKLAPDRPRGLIADRADKHYDEAPSIAGWQRLALRHLLAAPVVRPDFIAYDVKALPAPAPLLSRRLGLPLLTWTVRNEADRAAARRYADQMIFENFDPEA